VQPNTHYDIPMSSYPDSAKANRSVKEYHAARFQVLQHGWNSTSYQILNEGFERWWSADRQALVGFVRVGKCAVVAGAPICSKTALGDAIDEWEDYAQRQGLEVCYFGAEARLQNVLKHSAEHTQAHIGLNPEWNPESLGENFKVFPSLRAQINRAVNKGVSVKLLVLESNIASQ
jgi:phosphatidylglycerol lysyltransferase